MTAAQRGGTSVPDPTSHGMGPTAAVCCAVAEVQGQGLSTLYSKSGQASLTTSGASRVHCSHSGASCDSATQRARDGGWEGLVGWHLSKDTWGPRASRWSASPSKSPSYS